jgi:hypothetical protein
MAWESRGGVNRYFTMTRRSSRRKRVRTYYGAGVFGDLASSMLELREQERQERDQRHRQDCLKWQALEARLERFCEGVNLLTNASFFLAGFRNRKGEWRRMST